MSATDPECPRKRSDMTPCVLEHGDDARADDGVCVGCGVRVPARVVVNRRECTDGSTVQDAAELEEYWRAAVALSIARALLDEYDNAREFAAEHPGDADARRVLRVIRNTVLSVLQGAAGHQPNGSELGTNPK